MIDVLIERGDFLASLEGLLGEAHGGSGRLVFLGGEAGVGKTTLAAALINAADAQVVRRGSCDNVTMAEALGPLVDALPEVAEMLDGEAAVSRLRLFRHVRDMLSEPPTLLVLEDVQWADEATLEVLRFMGRRLGGTRLMILATFRSEEVGSDHPLTVVLGDLAALPGVILAEIPSTSRRCSQPAPSTCRRPCVTRCLRACPGSRGRGGKSWTRRPCSVGASK